MFFHIKVSHNKEKKLSQLGSKIRYNELGANLVEYMLLVSLITIAALVAVQAAGKPVSSLYSHIADELTQAMDD